MDQENVNSEMSNVQVPTASMHGENTLNAVEHEAEDAFEHDSPIAANKSASPSYPASAPYLKKDVNISANRMDSQAGSEPSTEHGPLQASGEPWKTTFLRYGPLAGIGCMLIAAGSIIVSLGVLLGSDRAAVAKWGATPSAILAICTAVANQSLRFAAFQGFVVAWWFNASRGTTLRQLHVHWRAGTTFAGAFLAGRNMGLIGLACIFSTLVAVDGPLRNDGLYSNLEPVQKATTVVSAPISDHPLMLNISMSPEVPRGYTGGWVRSNVTQYRFDNNFNDTVPTASGSVVNNIVPEFGTDIRDASYFKPWFQDDTVRGIAHGCDAVCKATVRAPALAQTSCVRRKISVNYTLPTNYATIAATAGVEAAAPLDRVGFMVSGGLLLGDHERMNLITAYSNVDQCAGELHMTICTLEAAIGEYNVTIDHDKVILGDDGPRIVALANNTQVDYLWNEDKSRHPSTLAGVVALAFIRYAGLVTWFESGGNVGGAMQGTSTPESYVLPTGLEDTCHSYADPRQNILHGINKLMFNIGAVAAQEDASFLSSRLDPGLVVNTTTTGYLKGQHNIFHTNLRWFAAAAAVEAFCIALILPTYIGFWRLGRRASFSPLEVAKAFEAPMFAQCNSNSSGKDIADQVGDNQVQYGATRSPFGQTKLAFAPPSFVQHPAKDSRFDI